MKKLRRILCLLIALAMLLMAVPVHAVDEPVDEFDDDLEDDMIIVSAVNVTVADPEIGELPAATATLSSDPEGCFTDDAVAVAWEKYDADDGFVALASGDVFEKGGIYRAVPDTDAVREAAAEGCLVGDATLFINGQDYYANEGAVFGPLGLTLIKKIGYTVAEPELGAAPATSAKVACEPAAALTADSVEVPGWLYLYSAYDPSSDGEAYADDPIGFDPLAIDFDNIDKTALLTETGIGDALLKTGLMSVLMKIDLDAIYANSDALSAAMEALPDTATTQDKLDVLGIGSDIVTGEALDAMIKDFTENYWETINWERAFEILGFELPSADGYVAKFEYGGYYWPDLNGALDKVIADGYGYNPFITEITLNGGDYGAVLGPVGFEKITSVELGMTEPTGGTAVEIPGYDPENDSGEWAWEDQSVHPAFTVNGQHISPDCWEETGVYSYWYGDAFYGAPFVGTYACGDTYYAAANFSADYGYVFAKDVKVTVNGKELSASDDTDSTADTFYVSNKLYLWIAVKGDVAHDWGERTLTGKEDGSDIYTSICKACGEKRTEKLPSFKDVVKGAFYEEAVLWAVLNNVTNGTGKDTFSPNNKCTRGQVVTFLWRAAGSPEPTVTAHPFTDVKSDAFYYKAMLWAVEKKITNGISATAFGPGKECTRGQVVTFLWRAVGSPEPTVTAHPFTDVKSDAFYYKAMLWAVEKKITNGTTATTFGPGKTCTRGQVVTFLYRAYK